MDGMAHQELQKFLLLLLLLTDHPFQSKACFLLNLEFLMVDHAKAVEPQLGLNQ
jgi:hypothetical protein